MNVRLLVLGLLADQPRHGYEIRKLAELNRIEAWTGILPGSIYHALRKLAAERLIEIKERARQGSRVREVYRITRAGRSALTALVREAWEDPRPALPTSLYGAILFGSRVPAREARRSVAARRAAVRREIEAWERARPLKGPMTATESALYDNGLAHLRIDLELIDRLSTGRPRKRDR